MEKKIPDYVLRDLREKMDLEPDDPSKDRVIMDRSPLENLRAMCGWHFGDPSWAHSFIEWAEAVGFEVKRKEGW